jgi:hypothetical protein
MQSDVKEHAEPKPPAPKAKANPIISGKSMPKSFGSTRKSTFAGPDRDGLAQRLAGWQLGTLHDGECLQRFLWR